MGFDCLSPLRKLYHILWDRKEVRTRQRSIKEEYLGRYHEMLRRNPKTVFLLMTPQHENLGDHAIAFAETEFLKQHGIDYLEITGEILDHLRNNRVLSLMNGYPILMQGGGYLGTLWPQSEEVLREIIQSNPKSDIILFPNTIFYESTQWGQTFYKESIELYAKHKSLHLYAREKTSYEVMGRAYRNVKLIPDMVFSLNRSDRELQRSGCLLSLRNDGEKTRTQTQEESIRRQAKELFGNEVRDSDMVADVCIPAEQRESALEAKFTEFASAKLVITDRLHGMVFCAITGTPCIVLNSKSPKVRGCYEWIRDLEYIRFVDDVSKILEVYREIPEKTFVYDNSHLSQYYQELADDIFEIFHWR